MATERTPIMATDAQTEKQHALTSYLKTLEGEGVDVDRLELVDSGDVELEYSMCEGADQDPDQEWFYIVGSYIPVQERGDLGDLKVTVHAEEQGTIRGCAKAEWCELFQQGELTNEGYLSRVQTTIEGVN